MASIRFITAPIGGGKSLFGTIQICEELQRTDRFIVTNIPLVLAIVNTPDRVKSLYEMLSARSITQKRYQEAITYWTIAEYCHAFIERPINVADRVICLTEDQTKEFWRYIPRGSISDEQAAKYKVEPFRNESTDRPCYGWKLPNVDHKQFSFVPDFTFRQQHPNGVYYVLDEVHQHFPARYWQALGPQAERYMSQLRKLNDDLDLLTQHPEKVDKNFRRNATDWLQVENMGSKHLPFGVSLPNRFRYHWYNQAEMPGRFEKPTRSGWYKIENNRRYQWLYKTAEGVGVAGGIIAEDKRFKGRHWSIWLIAVVAIFAFAYALPRVVEYAVAKATGAMSHGFQTGMAKGFQNLIPPAPSAPAVIPISPPPSPPPSIHWSAPAPPENRSIGDGSAAGVPPDGIYATGTCLVDGNEWVMLSDGTICKSENGEVQGVGEKFVRVNGWSKIPFHAAR